MKIRYMDDDVAQFRKTEEGRAYLEYNDKVGGLPMRRCCCCNYPPGVEEHGGAVAVYRECIDRNVTWEGLLGYTLFEDDLEK